MIGRSERADALSAAFLNAVSANVLEFDDTQLQTVIHPAAPVVPAVFALAELRRVSGDELLHAVVLGVEAECRIGKAVTPSHYRRGWHITSTCGVFGAAAAAGKLLGLDRQRMMWALGNAAAQSAGLIESLGSMAKSISVGNAARNGLAAALLAEQGFTGPERALEGTLRLRQSHERDGRFRRDHRPAWRQLGRFRRTPTSPTRAASCCSRSSTAASNCASAKELPPIELPA